MKSLPRDILADSVLTQVLNAALLPAGPAFTATAAQTIKAGSRRITWVVSYTKNALAATGQYKAKMVWTIGSLAGVEESFVDPASIVVTAPWGIVKSHQLHILGPEVTTATVSTMQYTFDVPAGATAGILQLTEVGDVVNLGTVTTHFAVSGVL